SVRRLQLPSDFAQMLRSEFTERMQVMERRMQDLEHALRGDREEIEKHVEALSYLIAQLSPVPPASSEDGSIHDQIEARIQGALNGIKTLGREQSTWLEQQELYFQQQFSTVMQEMEDRFQTLVAHVFSSGRRRGEASGQNTESNGN